MQVRIRKLSQFSGSLDFFYQVLEIICMGLPSVKAFAVFLLALCKSLQTVPREISMLFPASFWVNPSRSTSLRASSSAVFKDTGFRPLSGLGVISSIVGIDPKVTGLGNLPLLPSLLLRPLPRIGYSSDDTE